MGFLSKLFGKKPAPMPVEKYQTFDVLDLQIKAVLKFKDANDDYAMTKRDMIEWSCTDEKVYQYDFGLGPQIVEKDGVINLIEEDDNGKPLYLGRIADEDAEAFKALADSQNIHYVNMDVTGGKYKILYWEHIRKTNKDIYTLEKGEDEYKAQVRLPLQEESTDGNS